jgi:hypothetical protein
MNPTDCQCRLLISEHVPAVVAEIIREYTCKRKWSWFGLGYSVEPSNSVHYSGRFRLEVPAHYFIEVDSMRSLLIPVFYFKDFEEFDHPNIVNRIMDFDSSNDARDRAIVSYIVTQIRDTRIVCDHVKIN